MEKGKINFNEYDLKVGDIVIADNDSDPCRREVVIMSMTPSKMFSKVKDADSSSAKEYSIMTYRLTPNK
jgi:hypothetical protein